jgi:flagellar M-ring protein FliF
VNSFLETLKQLGPSRLGIMGAILLGLLMFFIFVSLRISTPDMKLLYGDLSSSDSGAIASKLGESSIAYDMSEDGTKILVPEKDVGRARLLLAGAGLPSGGSMGYEIFDNQSGFGTTNFVQNINQVRALEGELARTIGSVQGVKSARVHLVLPQRELFSRESRPSSASVFLNVNGNADIENQQIVAIQSLVASAVAGLKSSNVSVIDSNGKLLAQGGNTDEASLISAKSDEMRRTYESRLEQKIEDQVGRVVGFGKVRATVTSEINFDQISTNEELFDPEGQVVRSSQTTNESSKEREAAGQSVSVENNLPAGGSLLGNGNEPSAEGNKTEEVTNYEISKTVRSTVREAGEVKRLSVAVLVDGSYAAPPPLPETATDEEKKAAEEAKATGKEVKTYVPRPQEELDRITALVKSSVGYDESRGDVIQVVNMQFASVDTDEKEFTDDRLLFGFEKNKLIDMAQILVVAIMIILVVMLVLQPMVNRLITFEAPEVDEKLEADLLAPRAVGPALAAPEFSAPDAPERDDNLINIQGVEGRVKASTVKKVEEIVTNYPTETVSVIRSWMTQEGT